MSCEKISFLIDKSELEELSRGERLRVRWHFSMCKLCKRYEHDSKALSRMFKRLAERSEKKILSKADKDRLKQVVSENS